MDIENRYGALNYQRITYEMMKDVHMFLVQKHIKYSLAGGSLLGAIREQGFIPWDDDLDIMMSREDFEQFIEVCDQLDGYVVSRMLWEYRIQRKCDYNGSLTGPTIDIAIMDKVPLSKAKQTFKLYSIKFLQGAMKKHIYYERFSFPHKMLLFVSHSIGKLFSDETKFSWYDGISQIGKNDNSKYLGIYNTLFKYLPNKYRINTMDDIEEHIFEDTMFLITKEYDGFLKTIYGDYLTPPPEEERKPAHL